MLLLERVSVLRLVYVSDYAYWMTRWLNELGEGWMVNSLIVLIVCNWRCFVSSCVILILVQDPDHKPQWYEPEIARQLAKALTKFFVHDNAAGIPNVRNRMQHKPLSD